MCYYDNKKEEEEKKERSERMRRKDGKRETDVNDRKKRRGYDDREIKRKNRETGEDGVKETNKREC